MHNNNEGPAITDYVLENLPDYDEKTGAGGYEILNASNVEESELAFSEELAKNLPPLTEMIPAFQHEPSYVDLYEVRFGERIFYVKDVTKRIQMEPELLEEECEMYERMKKYFGDYIVPSSFVTRKSKETGVTEHLIVQEALKGEQLKNLYRSYPMTPIPLITPELRSKMEHILKQAVLMYKETDFVVDLDFFFNPVSNEISIFDFDKHEKGDFGHLCFIAEFLNQHFDIPIPENLVMNG